jgi:hypothetical protein
MNRGPVSQSAYVSVTGHRRRIANTLRWPGDETDVEGRRDWFEIRVGVS